jgi:hypothetical protein
MDIHYRGEPVRFQEITAAQHDVEQEAVRQIHVPQVRPRPKPGKEHAYKRGYEDRAKRRRWETLCGAVGRSGSAPCCHQFESNLRGHF